MKSTKFAFSKALPIIISYFFLGSAMGVLLTTSGYSWYWAPIAAIFIYAGSMQFVMVSLLVNGVEPVAVILMTLLIQARQIFYGIGLINRFKGQGTRKFYMIHAVTDESYSLLVSLKYPDDLEINRKDADFWITVFCHCAWIFACTFGAVAGDILPIDMTGIDFVMTVFFLVIVIDQWKEFKTHIPAITGLVCGLLVLFTIGADNFILPALTLSLIVLSLLRTPITAKMGGAE